MTTTSTCIDKTMPDPDLLNPSDTFIHRHIGPSDADVATMLNELGYSSLDALSDAVVPESIRMDKPLNLGDKRGEHELLEQLKTMAEKNKIARSCIGMGYHDTITPPVILRNILENPGWYTQYTPYQAEIAQGRLEALLNFQTMVADLTGLSISNSSLLDEGTAAAEAMAMCWGAARRKKNTFFIDERCHPQTINVVQTRATSMGINLVIGKWEEVEINDDLCGVLVQYPDTYGSIADPEALQQLADRLHEAKSLLVAATDLLALTLIKPPGEWGTDIAIGSAQRFGVPMGGGGPHAAFMSCKQEFVRRMPGRIVGVSKDSHGNNAYRLAIQTREQHIKRERATSNICTAQVLLAIMASMYAVYHGPEGLKRIAQRVHALTSMLFDALQDAGYGVHDDTTNYKGPYFDTITVPTSQAQSIAKDASARGINVRAFAQDRVSISLDETTTHTDVLAILDLFGAPINNQQPNSDLPDVARSSDFLTHPVFNTYHSETELLRYINRLQSRDLSLTTSMIPLGSCTMKLNGTSEMLPVTWPEFARMHPFAPPEQQEGYAELCSDLEKWLAEITGFAAVSLQPNAGSQGEYAGLLAIRGYHESRGDVGPDKQRDVCLIPVSAHGTNPASAVIAGFQVVAVACDDHGNIDIEDLRAKAKQHEDKLGALMITYPSTHGVFEPGVREICQIVHDHGGQVYMDGANMNAQVGLTSPGLIGADVCHLNLHKTFCIPHGGGGPGMGPIGVAEHLAPFLPGNPLAGMGTGCGDQGSGEDNPKSEIRNPKSPVGPVSAAPNGSAAILPISWVYIALMGGQGLKRATQVAILNANYMANRLRDHYPVLYTGQNNTVAHEFIIDCRQFKKSAGVEIDDIAKRLMDYGFHAPTMSFPVPGTLMIEPTESESKAELDRLVDALISIRGEIQKIEDGEYDREDNVLKNAPHTAAAVSADTWPHTYSRELAAYPAPWTRDHKFWPHVGRIDNPYGDRNLFCTCVPMET